MRVRRVMLEYSGLRWQWGPAGWRGGSGWSPRHFPRMAPVYLLVRVPFFFTGRYTLRKCSSLVRPDLHLRSPQCAEFHVMALAWRLDSPGVELGARRAMLPIRTGDPHR